jgi:hypothetical protein
MHDMVKVKKCYKGHRSRRDDSVQFGKVMRWATHHATGTKRSEDFCDQTGAQNSAALIEIDQSQVTDLILADMIYELPPLRTAGNY